jgi:glycerophosphoryl diester phosphodiesterase
MSVQHLSSSKVQGSRVPHFVAHRGYSECYPENSLVGLSAALNAGAHFIEFDVQLSSDHIPVVFHDSNLQRICGVDRNIYEMSWHQLKKYSVNEYQRFGSDFLEEPIPSLQSVLALLKTWPKASAFVEIKADCIAYFGVELVVNILLDALSGFQSRCVLISFDCAALQAVQRKGKIRVGWVLSDWDEHSLQRARLLSPDLLICNVKKIKSPHDLWAGPWQWALYDIINPDAALLWFQHGAMFIETWDIGGMLRDPRFSSENVEASVDE